MRSIRWKLMLASFLSVLVPIYILNWYAVRSFDRFTSRAREEEMISQAIMLGEQYKYTVLTPGGRPQEDREADFMGTLRKYDESLQSRFQVLSPAGIVLFDSDPDPLVGADFSAQEEINNVINGGGYKAAWRITDDRSYVFYFVPVPVRDENGGLAGIAYVTSHTGRITKAIKKMVRDQRLVLLASLCLALMMSALLAQTMTGRLRRLTRDTISYAAGNTALKTGMSGNDEISRLGRAVSHMAAEIEKRSLYNRNFVSTVFHELKTPVTAIKGAAEVLEGGAADKKDARAKFLGNIRYEADRLTRMVGELSELTRLDTENLRGHGEKVDYCACVRGILERLIPTFDNAHASFASAVPDENISVVIMPDRIEQVISNLLENAFRYTPPSGKVELKVARGPGDTVETSVKDTGPGISPSNIGKVFDRFFTTEPRNVPKDYGSGLGLAIAKSIVENHQGSIRVESAPGQGAVFTFSLPVSKD